jgi:hypothetical protein
MASLERHPIQNYGHRLVSAIVNCNVANAANFDVSALSPAPSMLNGDAWYALS